MNRIAVALLILGLAGLTGCPKPEQKGPETPPPTATNPPPASTYPPVDVESAGGTHGSRDTGGAMEPTGRRDSTDSEELRPAPSGGKKAAAKPSGGKKATAKAKTYTVKKGDTLSEIAKAQYGDESQWKKIYNANKSKIKDPKKLQPGTTLTIP